jgi:hypothetical protein
MSGHVRSPIGHSILHRPRDDRCYGLRLLEPHGRTDLPAAEPSASASVATDPLDGVWSAGPNEGSRVDLPIDPEACGGSDGLACVRELGRFWDRNFDAILDEIELLRDGKPTVIRSVNAANVFVAVPATAEGLGKGFATGVGALLFDQLADAVCRNADEHGAMCVDVGPILTGPNENEPVDENSPESMQAVADALLATGLPELGDQSRLIFGRDLNPEVLRPPDALTVPRPKSISCPSQGGRHPR